MDTKDNAYCYYSPDQIVPVAVPQSSCFYNTIYREYNVCASVGITTFGSTSETKGICSYDPTYGMSNWNWKYPLGLNTPMDEFRDGCIVDFSENEKSQLVSNKHLLLIGDCSSSKGIYYRCAYDNNKRSSSLRKSTDGSICEGYPMKFFK